jgi:hypothetical protein
MGVKVPIVKVDNVLIGQCIERAGWRRGSQVAEFIAMWTVAAEDLGHTPGVSEFVTWWNEKSERTAWRRLKRFREAFPELGEDATPSDLAAAKSREAAPRRASPSVAGL